jgi:hypothetical protein
MGVVFDPQFKKNILFEKTAVWLWSQLPLRVQGDAGHPG